MSWARKVAVFVIKEIAKPALTKVGDHIGNATGNVIGRRIDPKHGVTPAPDAPPPPTVKT